MTKAKSQGSKNRAAGKAFERKVRSDMESKGWIVDRWTNQVSYVDAVRIIQMGDINHGAKGEKVKVGKLVPCKPLFNPFTKSLLMNSGGFPDFIIFRMNINDENKSFEVNGVECKAGDENHKYLNEKEKANCKYLLDHHIFNKILIAQRGEKRGQIKYTEFKNG